MSPIRAWNQFWFRPVSARPLGAMRILFGLIVLPAIAGLVTGDRSAYEYLCGSIEHFPDRAAMAEETRRAGFTAVKATPMTFGIVALHEATA